MYWYAVKQWIYQQCWQISADIVSKYRFLAQNRPLSINYIVGHPCLDADSINDIKGEKDQCATS